MTKKQLASTEFTFVNSDKSVMVERINDGRNPGSYLLKGYVESKERKGTYFQVDIVISDNKHNSIPWSNCTCTSTPGAYQFAVDYEESCGTGASAFSMSYG